MLDTEHPADWCDGIVAELGRRGFDFERIDRMRRIAWETVGWLNYDKMLWEWCHLDEKDIKTALEWQLRDGVIGRSRYEERLAMMDDLGRAASQESTGDVSAESPKRE